MRPFPVYILYVGIHREVIYVVIYIHPLTHKIQYKISNQKRVNHGAAIQIITQNVLAARLINLHALMWIILIALLMQYPP